MTSEVPHTVQSRARKLAKQTGVRYTAALAKVASDKPLPNGIILKDLKTALQSIQNSMGDNPCYTEETRSGALRAVTHLFRNKEKQPGILVVRGRPGTGQKDLAKMISLAVYGADDVGFIELYRDDSHVPEMLIDGCNWDVNRFRESYLRPRRTEKLICIVPVTDEDLQYRYPSDVNVWTFVPTEEHLIKHMVTLAADSGFEISTGAHARLRILMARDEHVFENEDWKCVLERRVSAAVDRKLTDIALGDGDAELVLRAADFP